jgi:hypothetical protein
MSKVAHIRSSLPSGANLPNEANARLIVSAVNQREELLDALECCGRVLLTALDWMPTFADASESDYEPLSLFRQETRKLAQKCAALRKAGEGA